MSVLSFTDARRTVELVASDLKAGGTESVPLARAAHRVLAQSVIADRDLPPFPRSTRDGFAVRSEDVLHAPTTLRVVGEIRAGADPSLICPELQSGTAVEIMTGASLPSGADAVIMVEYTSRPDEHSVLIERSSVARKNVVPAGAEARSGTTLLAPGTRLDYAAIASAASAGRAELAVFIRPRVAILTTGDEIVDVTAKPGPYQIRNSNSHSLAAQVAAAGGEPIILPIAPDEPVRLAELIALGLEHDLLLMTGGVSMGKHDLVEPVLAKFNARFRFTGAHIQPGKPIVFGEARLPKTSNRVPHPDLREGWDTTPFFGLPGNPVSTMVCFELFVRPVLDALSGTRPRPLFFTRARLASTLKTKTGLTRFLPATLSGALADTTVDLIPWHGSGDVVATARANCYIVVPPDRETIPAGEFISILLRGAEL